MTAHDWAQGPGRAPALRTAAPGAQRTLGRELLFVGVFLLAWVSMNPFRSLADARWLDLGDTSDLANQVGYATVGLCAVVVLWRARAARAVLMRPTYAATLLWLGVSVATSPHPSLSLRRLLFALLVVAMGAVAPLLPANRRRFGDLLAGVTLAVIALCYLGVVLVPDLAIHQVTDVIEVHLAGNWRGVFSHKNIAGEMMAIFVFVGLFVARTRSLVLGIAIVALSSLFLYFTEAKSATGFLPLVLALAWVSKRRWAVWLRMSAILLVLAGLNILSVGSLYSPAVASVTEHAFSDPTFTGRTEIWQIALDWIPERPLFGFGYGAFWQTPEVMFHQGLENDGSAATADHAHNAILNLAVTTGVPGAMLAALWALVLPICDLDRCLRRRADPALTNLFLRIWIFAVANCSFESILFARADPLWFTMLVAMFGLRYLATMRTTDAMPL